MGGSCKEAVQWRVKTEHGNTYKVCDAHLAWGLRFSGLPARVDEFPKKQEEDTGKIRVKETKR